MFLSNNPEIAEYAPDFVQRFNSGRPVESYRIFLKGYTKPARYLNGILPTTDEETGVKLPIIIPSITGVDDIELRDFFDGYEYRMDILQKIDDEVHHLAAMLRNAGSLTFPQRHLLSLSIWGNPACAFKYYEYNYQTDWLPHRHLPEHVILLEAPKQETVSPVPRVELGRYVTGFFGKDMLI